MTAARRPRAARRATKPKRGTLAASAYAAIKARIFSNEYGPGFQATEPEIAVALGMSRTPVREALVQLQQEGLVEVVPRRGMRVVPLSPLDMKHIYEVLTCLETTAVELLARKPPLPEDIVALEGALGDMDSALDRNDLDAWAEADERFHRALLDRCGNGLLAALAFAVWDKVHRARLVSLRLRPLPRQSNVDHRQLVNAIRRREAARARTLHGEHRARTSALLVTLLEQLRLTGL